MTDWFLQCPEPNPDWQLTPEEEALWHKLHAKVTAWEEQARNDVPTVSCEDGKFKPELHYG